jgi:hypothetical protein
MKFLVQVICVSEAVEHREQVFEMERQHLTMEWFEMIAGKSLVAFRREEAGETPSSKCFGFVQTYDEKPRRRLWELLKSQGMQENQQVVFLSDGGDSVRQLQEYLHPCSEHLIDWCSRQTWQEPRRVRDLHPKQH